MHGGRSRYAYLSVLLRRRHNFDNDINCTMNSPHSLRMQNQCALSFMPINPNCQLLEHSKAIQSLPAVLIYLQIYEMVAV